MGENSKIEWTDHTFNPWLGCTKVAAGCEHCYAEASMDKRLGRAKWGPAGTRVKTSAANWTKPLKWNREAQAAGVRKKVFCASLADVFEDWQGPILEGGGRLMVNPDGEYMCRDADAERVPSGSRWLTITDLRRDLFQLIDATPWLDWLLVTKRPENVRRMWPLNELLEVYEDEAIYQHSPDCPNYCDYACNGLRGAEIAKRATDEDYRDNVWLLTSIATQDDANKNIPELLKCRDLVPALAVSAEPLLGPIELGVASGEARDSRNSRLAPRASLDWIIVGGESGHGARPCHPDLVRSIRDQCQAAGVPFFFKQWGEWAPLEVCAEPDRAWSPCGVEKTHIFPDRETMFRIGKKAAGRLLDGREWSEFPEVPR